MENKLCGALGGVRGEEKFGSWGAEDQSEKGLEIAGQKFRLGGNSRRARRRCLG